MPTKIKDLQILKLTDHTDPNTRQLRTDYLDQYLIRWAVCAGPRETWKARKK
jgi:hypothetical protein